MKQTDSGLLNHFVVMRSLHCLTLGYQTHLNCLSHLNTFKYMYWIYTNSMPPQFRPESTPLPDSFHRLQRVRLEKRNQRLGWAFCYVKVFVPNQKFVGHLVLSFFYYATISRLWLFPFKSFCFVFKNAVAISPCSFWFECLATENTFVLFARIQSGPEQKKERFSNHLVQM